MTDFKTLEQEYLKIDPLDKKLIPFYEKHRNYFDKDHPNNNEELGKYLWMLSDIGQTYSFAHKHTQALPILDKTIELYRKHAKRLDIDLRKEQNFNTAIWCKGYSLFEKGKYYSAKSYFKKLNGVTILQKDYNHESFLTVCNWRIKNSIAVKLGIIGFLILVVKYSIKWISPENFTPIIEYSGFLGGILLIASGLIYKRRIKAHTANNGEHS